MIFGTFSEPFERTKFLMFESQLKKITPFASGQVQNAFKILHFGVKFCDLAQARKIKVRKINQSQENQFLALNNALEDLPLKIFCFVFKITSFKNMYDQGPRHLWFKFNNLFNKHFSLLGFFKSILSRENWRDGGGLLFKVGNLKLFKVDAIHGH